MPNLKNPMAPQELLVVGAALKAGIFDALQKQPASLEQLAQKLSMDMRALWTVVEALIALGYIVREQNCLQVTSEAYEMFFKEDSEKYIGYSLVHTFNVIKAWTQLPEILKSGQAPKREQDQQDIKGFMAAMKKNAGEIAGALVQICLEGLPQAPKVLDLGGGPLNYARPFAAAGSIVTVQDMPEVCNLMQAALVPGENITFVPGDFTAGVVPGAFDLIFLGNICHIYGEAENIRLYKNVRESLTKAGRIAILDFVRGISPRAELFAVNMLANTKTGGTWTQKQYTKWLETAGFGEVKLHDINGKQVITAVNK